MVIPSVTILTLAQFARMIHPREDPKVAKAEGDRQERGKVVEVVEVEVTPGAVQKGAGPRVPRVWPQGMQEKR